MSSHFDHPVLVIGASGKTGRRVVERLQRVGRRVRPVSRSTDIPFDWNDPATWSEALAGCSAAYVTYYPDLAEPGAADIVGRLAATAVDQGVRRLVLLAGRGEPAAEVAEEAVRRSGADLTVVRATWFAQNFSEDYMVDHVLSGTISLPAGDTPEPFVDADDIADVVVAALSDERHVGETYELTGPRPLTFRDVADELSRATGRAIEYTPVSIEEHERHALADGVAPEVVEMLTYLFSEILDGRNAHCTDDVAKVLGRPATDFAQYAQRTAATGVWDDNERRAD